MPAFDARLTSGVTVVDWSDARANPLPSRPHRMFRGTVGVPIVVSAIVEGVVGPADSGNAFTSDVGEWPAGTPCPVTAGSSGYSSIQTFTPLAAGHHLFTLRRPAAGALCFPIEVVAA